jgi:hypothetical protein
MRIMLKFTFDAEGGNELLQSGRINELLQHIMEDLKPEAAYFYPENGQRSGHFIIDAQDSADLVRVCEPFWFALKADIELVPVMSGEDMQKGLGGLSDILQRYGR